MLKEYTASGYLSTELQGGLCEAPDTDHNLERPSPPTKLKTRLNAKSFGLRPTAVDGSFVRQAPADSARAPSRASERMRNPERQAVLAEVDVVAVFAAALVLRIVSTEGRGAQLPFAH